jgi:hypothetical protein
MGRGDYMKINVSFKYQFSEYKNPVIIYYLTFISLITFIFYLSSDKGNSSTEFNGTGLATAIFLFVMGLNSFKESFLMFLQNSVSRKTVYAGRILSAIALSIGMAFMDQLLMLLGNLIIANNLRLEYRSMVETMYMRSYITPSQMYLEGFLFNMVFYLAAFTFGYFITIAYYRMNKALKIIVSVGVPAGYFILLPIIDYKIFNGKIFKAIGEFLMFALGSPYYAMTTFFILFLIFSNLSWIMLRKAVDKN